MLLLVEQHLSRHILEHIGDVGEFDATPGTGIAVLIDVEDAVGVAHQRADGKLDVNAPAPVPAWSAPDARDFARFGLLYLRDGMWEGKPAKGIT